MSYSRPLQTIQLVQCPVNRQVDDKVVSVFRLAPREIETIQRYRIRWGEGIMNRTKLGR